MTLKKLFRKIKNSDRQTFTYENLTVGASRFLGFASDFSKTDLIRIYKDPALFQPTDLTVVVFLFIILFEIVSVYRVLFHTNVPSADLLDDRHHPAAGALYPD